MTIVNQLVAIAIFVTVYLVIPVYGLTTQRYWLCSTWLLPFLALVMIPIMGNRHVKIVWQKTIESIRSIIH